MKTLAAVILAGALMVSQAWAGSAGESVDVRIISDDGRSLPTYPVKTKTTVKKVYAEAVKGEHYRIEVTNRLNRRVGVVIAVDGRNIVSGEKSWLKNSERMYILEPFASGSYSGWRTGNDKVNRFYFTDVPDSYASAFGDESAMGVIAVAAYPEVRRYQPPPALYNYESRSGGAQDRAESAPAAPSAADGNLRKKSAKQERAVEGAGTGYGREEYSPVHVVEFEPESRAIETVYFKYEWRASLCKMGVIRCEPTRRRPANRLWDNGGYAPPPPGR